ncbi:MAG: hypothetical protein J0M15_15275 [Deltaproteobacteria bacterium]|nr:hypothetical protein [Deltaproteobacteria bacterium]
MSFAMLLTTNVCRILAFLFLVMFSLGTNASECRSFYEGKKRVPLTNRQVLELLLNPVDRKSEEFPISIVSSYLTSSTRGGKSVLVSDTITTKGYAKTVYDYESFEVEIIRPLIKSKTSSVELEAVDPKLQKLLRQKEKLHGTEKETNLLIGRGAGDMIQIILEQLNFVFERYISDKGWPPSFLQKLFYVAFNYASQSTYVVVREKGQQGGQGRIIGSIRLISTPYSLRRSLAEAGLPQDKIDELARALLATEKHFLPGFRMQAENPSEKSLSFGIPNWRPDVWKNVFSQNEINVPASDIASTTVASTQDGLLSIPAPFEKVLGRTYSRERLDDVNRLPLGEKDLGFFIEPGNFAMIPDRDLPPGLRGLTAPALYFHIARLVRKEAGAAGPATRIGTYASEGSSSDRFYQSLGFGLHEQITPDKLGSGNPTSENWNVLMGNGQTLSKALLNRFRLRISEPELDKMFQYFDEFEQISYRNSFFERLSDRLVSVGK